MQPHAVPLECLSSLRSNLQSILPRSAPDLRTSSASAGGNSSRSPARKVCSLQLLGEAWGPIGADAEEAVRDAGGKELRLDAESMKVVLDAEEGVSPSPIHVESMEVLADTESREVCLDA